ncbi:MAG TPA: hypothetical protein VGI33_09400 [Paenibacillus sp.]|jgi:hypothetical protein
MNPNIHVWANLSLNAHIYIREVAGNKIMSKRRPIFLMELCDNAICFLSDLDLPLKQNVIFGFDIEDSSSVVKLSGKLDSKGMYEQSFQYRVELHSMKEHQLYNTSLLKRMLLNLNYFFVSKDLHVSGMRRNINVSI